MQQIFRMNCLNYLNVRLESESFECWKFCKTWIYGVIEERNKKNMSIHTYIWWHYHVCTNILNYHKKFPVKMVWTNCVNCLHCLNVPNAIQALHYASQFNEIDKIAYQFVYNIHCIVMFARKLYRNATNGDLELSKSQSHIREMNDSRKVVDILVLRIPIFRTYINSSKHIFWTEKKMLIRCC